MQPTILIFSLFLDFLQDGIKKIKDPRSKSNATKFKIDEAMLSAFSMFFMQSQSFLEYQRQMQSRSGKNNVQSIFGVEEIPCDQQIRNILDLISATSLNVVFERIYQFLQNGKHLQQYERLEKNLLICLDGTEYHSSSKISCECCSTRNHRNGKVTYSHTAILPIIAAPNCAEVISLPPEFVTPQDGHEKQDCETAAAKRWISKHRHLFQGQALTLLGDDLYSRQPMCQHCLDAEMNFIFTCLPSSHSSLYEWLDYLEKNGAVQHLTTKHRKGKSIEIYTYRFVNQIPLREQEPALLVNWCELTVRDSADDSEVFHNAFVTNHALNIDNIAEVVEAGRCRWKTENENHNTLKTKGYNLEHNFGHGEKHLSSTLLSLNLLAFLFHTVLQLIDSSYQEIRRKRGTRRGSFKIFSLLPSMLSLFFMSVFVAFFAAIAHAELSDYRVSAIRYKSRDGLPKIFEGKYENSNFLEEFVGIRKYDDLATNLPTGLTGKDIVQMIAPNEDLSLAISVGVKPFPYKLNSYVAVVCFARNKNEYERLKGYYGCEKKTYNGGSPTQDRDDMFYLGLIEYEPTNSKPKLITKPIKIETGWDFVSPKQFRSASDRNSNLLPTGVYKYFDFAPFKVSDTQAAFGMRVWRTEGYSGGSGYFEVLALLMVDNDKILNIFAEPMYFYMNMKGDWNKDRTPSPRRLYEGENVLVVLPSQTDGYYDLQLKAVDSDWQKTFSWDSSLKRYLPSDRTAILDRVLSEIFNLSLKRRT